MYFDTHSHLTLCENLEIEEHLRLCSEKGVTHILDPGLHPGDYAERYQKLKSYPNVLMGVALAPHAIVSGREEQDLVRVKSLVETYHPAAFSEIGLDYHLLQERQCLQGKTLQREVFSHQLELAKCYDLPVFLHVRDAFDDACDLVKASGVTRGAVHCFSAGIREAKLFLDVGFYLSIPGIVTFKNAPALREVVRVASLDKLLIETDSPYLAPVPHRGRPNNSSYVPFVAQTIAIIKEKPLEEVAAILLKNSFDLLKLT